MFSVEVRLDDQCSNLMVSIVTLLEQEYEICYVNIDEMSRRAGNRNNFSLTGTTGVVAAKTGNTMANTG